MSRPAAKGWCPGALRPMMSGDGLLVRIRPRLGRLDRDQVDTLCTAATTYGSGLIELTNRANIQIRGVVPHDHDRLLAELDTARLVDLNGQYEARDNIMVSPLWQHGDDTWRIAGELRERLHELPALPAKFGFAVDASGPSVLSSAPADLRVERGQSGGLILRLDGATSGEPTTVDDAVERIIEICRWFVETGGMASKRMARHTAQPPTSGAHEQAAPVVSAQTLVPGPSAIGPVYGALFGSMVAGDLAQLVRKSGAVAVRTTPWRLFILEGGEGVQSDAFISDPAVPLQNVSACPGALSCPSATVETRALARELSRVVRGELHVSGCTKGCARPSRAAITVVGRDGNFDIVRNGCAWDAADLRGLDAAEVADRLGAN